MAEVTYVQDGKALKGAPVKVLVQRTITMFQTIEISQELYKDLQGLNEWKEQDQAEDIIRAMADDEGWCPQEDDIEWTSIQDQAPVKNGGVE